MTNAESIQALMREICVLIEGNIRPDGECQFDSVKVKLALELVNTKFKRVSRKTAKRIDYYMGRCYNKKRKYQGFSKEDSKVSAFSKCQLAQLC